MDLPETSAASSEVSVVPPVVVPPAQTVRRNFISLMRDPNGPLSRVGKLMIVLSTLGTLAMVSL